MLVVFGAALALTAPSYEGTSGVRVSCSQSSGSEVGRAKIEIVVGSGALNEPKGKEGVAHLVEHVLLRPLDLDDNNGATDWDSTVFLSEVAQTALSTAAVSLIEAVANPRIEAQDFERERNVVLRELDDRGEKVRWSQPDPIFGGTSFDRSIGGTGASVRALSASDVLDYHRANYLRGNIAVVLSGAIDCARIRARIAGSLDHFAVGSAVVRPIEPRPTNGERALGGVRDPSLFVGGFYWYEEDLRAEITLRVVARHLQERALDELRARRGITYSPHGVVLRMAGAGVLRFIVTTDGEASAVADWYRGAIDELRATPTPAKLTRRAITALDKDVSEDHVRAALAAIRGEPSPNDVLGALDDATMHAALKRLIAPERAFSTTTRSTGGLIAMFLLAVAVLGFLGFLARTALRG